MLDLTIVLPTCNRGHLLAHTIAAIERETRRSHEIVVVDGASTDCTRDVLAAAQQNLGPEKLRIIREETRQGFVKAVNRGFKEARGKYMTWLNDDARPMNGALDSAVFQLEGEPADVGFVAMFHCWANPRNIAYETRVGGHTFRLCHIRGTLYGNFPVGLTSTYQKLGYFDERYYVKAADPDLSLKAWHAGMRVVPAWGAVIDHDELEDDRRFVDSERGRDDNAKLFAKWELPPKNLHHNDFDPTRPCTLIGLRDGAKTAEAA